MDDDYEEWSLSKLRDRVKLVQELDSLADDLVSQYKSVILNLQCAHAIMLMRAIVYTAITRARLRLTIVGERKALCRAIRNTKADQRGTRLAQRIQDFIE